MTQYDAVDEDFDYDDERDYWQEYKDDRAMGRIDEDGNWLDPDPPPDCYACNDTGLCVDYDTGRDHNCPECGPSPLRSRWWRVTDRVRHWWARRRANRSRPFDGESPF